MQIVPFKKEHLLALLEAGFLDKKIQPFFLPEYGEYLEKTGNTFTMVDETQNNKPVVFGGATKFYSNRAEVWLVFGKPKTETFIVIYKMLVKWLEKFKEQFDRLEMVVDFESQVQHRWAKILGFEQEAYRLKKYMPHGGDATMYSWVRK